MAEISISGYKPTSMDDIRNNLINTIKEKNPDFYTETIGSIQENLITTGAYLIKYNNDLINYLFNGVSLNSVDSNFLDLLANDYNLSRLSGIKASCTISITGTPGYILPTRTKFTNAKGNVVFQTNNEIIINSLGTAEVVAYSDSLDDNIKDVKAGDINKLVIDDDNIKIITNKQAPTRKEDAENDDTFRNRIQKRMRNLHGNTLESLYLNICNVEGVIQRLVNIVYKTNQNIGSSGSNKLQANTVEVIVEGGDSTDIVYQIFNSIGLNPIVFVSNPTDKDTTRTIEQQVKFLNSMVTLKYTKPKQLKLALNISPVLNNVLTNANQLKLATQDYFIDYFKNVNISTSINKTLIEQLFIKSLREYGYDEANIQAINFTYTVDGKTGALDSNGFFSEKQIDTYFSLTDYEVSYNV